MPIRRIMESEEGQEVYASLLSMVGGSVDDDSSCSSSSSSLQAAPAIDDSYSLQAMKFAHANQYGTLQAFENTSTNIAAAQMRNALTALGETVKDPAEKKVRITGTKRRRRRCGPCVRTIANARNSSSRRRWTTSSLSSDGT